MGRDLDIDDAVAQYPEAKAELAALRADIQRQTEVLWTVRQQLAQAQAENAKLRGLLLEWAAAQERIAAALKAGQ